MNLLELSDIFSRRLVSSNPGEIGAGEVIYLMNRDQRVQDNFALLAAQEIALTHKRPLAVVYIEPEDLSKISLRQFSFMIEGFKQVASSLCAYNISFDYYEQKDGSNPLQSLAERDPAVVVTDFSPLRSDRRRLAALHSRLQSPVMEIDTHNIVPVHQASNKQEFAARTLRPKIERLLSNYLIEPPPLIPHPFGEVKDAKIPWDDIKRRFNGDRTVPSIDSIESGENEAHNRLREFIEQRLDHYATDRNDPTLNGQSNLSPYLHFGQISALRIALELDRVPNIDLAGRESFLEELIVRKELSDNYCYYNENYDNFTGFPEWAQKSLNEHRSDPREHLYTHDQFEKAETEDPLWNAAQTEMLRRGKMHGFMRMYWAKKIFEWSPSPEIAQEIAIDLNDRYSIDGRDPSGYVGIAWSIGGLHDRAWFEKDIFGKVRYMNANGCGRKFDVDLYIDSINHLPSA